MMLKNAVHPVRMGGTNRGSHFSGRMISYLLLIICTILMGSTLYGQGEVECLVYMCVIAAIELTTILSAVAHHSLEAKHIIKWLRFIVFVFAIYIIISLVTGHFGSNGLRGFLLILCISPLYFLVLAREGTLKQLAKIAVFTISVLAAASLLLWIIGPIMGWIPFNCIAENRWNPGNELAGYFQGYFGLLYQTQWQQIGSVSIVRNTGIFTEGPMYVYVLVITLAINEFYLPGEYRLFTLLLVATLISTLSVTGIVGIVLVLFLKAITSEILGLSKITKIRVTSVLALAALCGLGLLVYEKLRTPSGSIHFDDYLACAQAWLSDPLFGIGFSNDLGLAGYMSEFRLDNTGYSNTLPYVLATGGLAYFSIWTVALFGYFSTREGKHICFGLVSVFLLVTTAATTLFSTALMLAFGVYLYFKDDSTSSEKTIK